MCPSPMPQATLDVVWPWTFRPYLLNNRLAADAPLQGWAIPLCLQLLPPAVATWRSACRYMPTSTA